ncbi:MAG TPA: thermonuclease family protein [Actinomycetota bacterium]|nr:thermonuclease family protein [Actinomycetota bacterium]
MRWLGLIILLATAAASCSPHQVQLDLQAPATRHDEPAGFETAIVREVIDGDTLTVELVAVTDGPGAGATQAGDRYDVRLLGIDTPESVDPSSEVECFGPEAAAATDALLAGSEIVMVRDTEDVDRYGRLLRYVYFGSEMANARLLVNGYARTLIYEPNLRHASMFEELENRARSSGRGLWAPDIC